MCYNETKQESPLRNVLVFTFALIILGVHGYAPGSGRFCLINKTYTNGACDHKIATTTEISAPDCCSDECMIGSNVNLPSTELSPQNEIAAKTFQAQTLLAVANFAAIPTSGVLQFYFSDNLGSSPPPSQMTRLAKLQILLV